MHRPAAVEITYDCMKFLITHNPTNATLNRFTEVRLLALVLLLLLLVLVLAPPIPLTLSSPRCLPGPEEVPRQHTGQSVRCHLRQGAGGEGRHPGGGE